MNTINKSRIFISYSHRGKGPEWKAKLLRALHVFEQQNLLDVWQDGKIRVSTFWDDDIRQAMANARVAVVLLTKDALDTRTPADPNYILNTEFPILRERQRAGTLTVFPVICEECDWRAHDWLRATQAPNNSNPLAQLSDAGQDHEFRKLATSIAEEMSRISLAESSALRTPHSGGDVRLYVDKFPLTRATGLLEEKLIGREQELALLDLAFAQPHTAIVSLVAWGGVGKTMLFQHWLQRLQREGWFGARRVYAWSFYSQGTREDRQASEDTFLAHALEWFGVQCEPTLSPWDKGRLLADAVARECTLLILDGIEPLQYPPGPMGGQLRAPGVQSLLKVLARKASSDVKCQKPEVSNCLCLLTTREPLTDLADFQRREGSSWGSVLRVDLGNLTDEAGAALLHHAGANRAGAAEIKPDGKELLAASREVDGHALTLNLLGRFLARAHGGDIRRRDLVKFEEADRKEQGGSTFKMLVAFENWFAKSGEFGARQLAILRMLGLFDRPADAGCIATLRKPPVITGLTEPLFHSLGGFLGLGKQSKPVAEEDWNNATSFLADFGLVLASEGKHEDGCLLDCHPLIREHFAQQVRRQQLNAWRNAHRRLYEYLCESAPEVTRLTERDLEMLRNRRPLGKCPTLEDLQPLYQAVAHGCQAGGQQKACDTAYKVRILRWNEKYSIKKLGALGCDLSAVIAFFETPWSGISSNLKDHDQAFLLNEAAYRLKALGRSTEAIDPMRAALQKTISMGDWRNAAINAHNLSELELTLGEVVRAVEDAKKSVNYADMRGDLDIQVEKRTMHADALHQAGHRIEALTRFQEAEQMQSEAYPEIPQVFSVQGFRYCDLLLATPERAAWAEMLMAKGQRTKDGQPSLPSALLQSCRTVSYRTAQSIKIVMQLSDLLSIALDHLTLGRAALYGAFLSKPEIEQAVHGLRRAGMQDDLPRGLLTRAWLRSMSGDAVGAQADLDEAWDIAERGPMRLHMADIHLYRARLFFREKPYRWKSPQDDLAAAEKLINDCGYHRRDEELADAKKAILGTN